jgi:hypothetical protein
VILTKFHNFDMWQKFWKGNENMRSVYKKPFFKILSGFLSFLTFNFSKSIHFLRDKNFFPNMANRVPKNPSFHSDFNNVYFIIAKKTILLIENLQKSQKIRFLAKHFECTFQNKVNCTFLKSV